MIRAVEKQAVHNKIQFDLDPCLARKPALKLGTRPPPVIAIKTRYTVKGNQAHYGLTHAQIHIAQKVPRDRKYIQ